MNPVWTHPNSTVWQLKRGGTLLAEIMLRQGFNMLARIPGTGLSAPFTSIEEAKRWCEIGWKAPEPTPDDSSEETEEDEEAVGRLLQYLHTHPDLAWRIAQKVKVLSPWHQCTSGWRREDLRGRGVVTVDLSGWSIQGKVTKKSHADSEAAKQACDLALMSAGWCLATRYGR